MGQPQKVLVCGSRGWLEGWQVINDMRGLSKGSLVIHGGAPGADMQADHAARLAGHHVAVVKALWDVHGKAAGPLRNEAMLSLKPDVAFAYDLGTPGTADMLRRLAKANVPTIIRYPAETAALREVQRDA